MADEEQHLRTYTEDQQLLIDADSLLSLVLYREYDGLSLETRVEIEQLVGRLRKRTDEIIHRRY